MKRAIIAIAVLLCTSAHAQVPDQSDRMLGAAKLWAKTKFLHPYFAYQDIDWDGAFVRAMPKIEAATTIDQYRDALAEMLGVLNDPATRVVVARPEPAPKPASSSISFPAPGVMLVDLAGFTAAGFEAGAFATRGDEVEKQAATAKAMIVDLRSPQPPWIAQSAVGYFVKVLPAIDAWPAQRYVEHHGWRTQDGGTSFYYTAFSTYGAQPPKPAPPAGPKHVVFIADSQTLLPLEAIALQGGGRATIVATGPLDASANVDTTRIDLPGGLAADIRIGESLWGPPRADAVVPEADARTRAIEIARAAIDKPPATSRVFATPRQAPALPDPAPHNDNDYASEPYPSRELRMLAGIRVWGVLEYFFPYRSYMTEDWDKVLRETLPRLAAAKDRDAYIGVLREMAARTGDGHVGISPATKNPSVKPRGLPGVVLRLVENKLVVTRLLDAKQIEVGDVVETIDGRAAALVLDDKRPQVSGSTVESREQRNAFSVLYGEDGSTVKLGVRDRYGKLKEITLTRTADNAKAAWESVAAPHWKKLANNIGYIDLTELTIPEVDAALAELEKTRAIIFDIRGYPHGTAWALAPRLNVKGAKYGAEFLQPLVADNNGTRRTRFLQEIPPLPANTPIYRGKVVALIDDRAISQAEHTCLFIAAVAPTTFIGSPTHGANGDITQARLPGGLRLTFTGQEVRWPDGRQLQRVGVQPDIVVRPTLAGIRAHKDEVLDRAVAWILKAR